MTWARVWGRVKILVKSWLNQGESLISLSMARMARDREEFRRNAQPLQLANALTILDIILTIMFVIVLIVVLALSTKEKPMVPLRMWIIVYAFHCGFHIAFSVAEFQGGPLWQSATLKLVECGKDGFYLLWWALGMFFIMKGGDSLFKSAPMLTGTVMFFAAFDILLFMGVLYVVAGLSILLFCCCPFLCAIFYYIGDPQELPLCPWC